MATGHVPFSLIVILVWVSGSASADGSSCDCRCNSRSPICEDLGRLRAEVDANTGDRRKWNRHFQFVQNFHRRWEEEVAKVLKQEIENLRTDQTGAPDLGSNDKKLHEMLSKTESRNLELKNKINELELMLRATTNRAVKLEADLRNEKGSRRVLEEETNKRQSLLQTQTAELASEVMNVGQKLSAVERTAVTLLSELEKEKEIRTEIKNEIDGILPMFRGFDPANVSRQMKEFENSFAGLGKKLKALEGQGMLHGYEIYKEQNQRKKLESYVSRMQSASLKAADTLRPVVPSSVVEKMRKELNVSLGVSGDWKEDSTTEKFGSLSPDIETDSLRSNPYVEMSSKLEDLEANMKVLTHSLGKAMSNIRTLESKYQDALKSQTLNSQPLRPNQRTVTYRPFDPLLDP